MHLTVNFHHDGNFVPSPLMYLEGEKSIIRDLEFKGMIVIRLSKLLQGTCMFLVKGIFFLIPGKELSNGLIEIKNDLDLTNCIAVGYKNGKVVDMFLEHHGYDLSHWIQTDIDNNDDELSDVEMEDITGYGASDFVGEDDVVIPNRNPNSRCRAFFKIDRGCATYENGISESYHNAIRIARVSGSAMWLNTPEEPPLPLVLRKMPGRPRKLRIKHVTERPQPTVEKRTPGRKKADSNFVFPTGGKNGGDAGPSIADPTDSEASYAGDTGFMNKDETVTEDPIEESQVDDIPTQQSKTSQKTAKIIEDAIATGKLKTAGLKRRCKSERIAKRAKPFQFGKDGAGSCADKAWDVDEVLAEE
ncbi:hypothetical protein Tco_0629521 [Tanacetum coccineum]|uniref:PB1-like domain-containing protein n=1 Tax=Tanacetum coccineum TaxID=301880 RepID=A0ABQ4WTC6_9ASTR